MRVNRWEVNKVKCREVEFVMIRREECQKIYCVRCGGMSHEIYAHRIEIYASYLTEEKAVCFRYKHQTEEVPSSDNLFLSRPGH